MAEDWNVNRDRWEVTSAASDPACTAQSNCLVLFQRHRPGKKKDFHFREVIAQEIDEINEILNQKFVI